MIDKKIMGLMGYTASDVLFEPMNVITEINTGGEDSGGYENAQTLGVAINQYNEPCLYIGSITDIFDQCPALVFGGDVSIKKVSDLLRALADELERN